VSPEERLATEARVRKAVAGAGAIGLDLALLDEHERALLPSLDDVAVDGGRARPRSTSAASLAAHPFVVALEAQPFSPPEPAGVDRAELRELVRRGLVVDCEGSYFAPASIAAAAKRVAELLAAEPEGVTVAQVRDALGTTRKHALPLLAHLDATGVTRRRGDLRIAGPRLPER